MTLLREASHEAWGWKRLEELAREVRYGLRQFGRSPGFTAAAVLTLGLGANTVAARTREFGIRIASAAGARDILRLMVGDGAVLCAAGLAAGLPAAWVAGADPREPDVRREAGRCGDVSCGQRGTSGHGPGGMPVAGLARDKGRSGGSAAVRVTG